LLATGWKNGPLFLLLSGGCQSGNQKSCNYCFTTTACVALTNETTEAARDKAVCNCKWHCGPMTARAAQHHQPCVQACAYLLEPNIGGNSLIIIEVLESLFVESKFAVHADTAEGLLTALGSATLGLARMSVGNDAARTRRRRSVELLAESAADNAVKRVLLQMDNLFVLRAPWNWCFMTSDFPKQLPYSALLASSQQPGPDELKLLTAKIDEFVRLRVTSSSCASSSNQGFTSGIANRGSPSQAFLEECAAAAIMVSR